MLLLQVLELLPLLLLRDRNLYWRCCCCCFDRRCCCHWLLLFLIQVLLPLLLPLLLLLLLLLLLGYCSIIATSGSFVFYIIVSFTDGFCKFALLLIQWANLTHWVVARASMSICAPPSPPTALNGPNPTRPN
jgi:hypothetical protein